MERTALVVGATGIVGYSLARHLTDRGWKVLGLARHPPTDIPDLIPIAVDLLDPSSLREQLSKFRPTHVFIAAWLKQANDAEDIRVNGPMVKNLLDVLALGGSVEHVALVTGLKHYMGPFEMYVRGVNKVPTPFRETQPRLDAENFYYVQEDLVFDAARREGFTWSVHRPNTMVGYAIGNGMNLAVTLAVYATICREFGRPFRFPGSAVQWNGLKDVTDARLLAKHLEWAATTPAAKNQALNVVNGDIFRWSWMWDRLAEWFYVEPIGLGEDTEPLTRQLAGGGEDWARIAARHKLREASIDRLASPWHTDAVLGLPIEGVVDMTKSRKLGFVEFQESETSFYDVFKQLRDGGFIPPTFGR